MSRMDLQLLALLLVSVALLAWRAANRERREYTRFTRLRSTTARQKFLRRWLIESVLVIGGLAAALLLAVWDDVPRVLGAMQAWEPVAATRGFLVETPVGVGLTIALAVLTVAFLVVPVVLLRNTPPEEIPQLGNVRALLPRTRAELPYGAGLAVSAGIFEEALFRLAYPALLFGIVPDAPLAFLVAGLLFGAMHAYQRALGVLTATILGIVFAALYVVSGSIVLAMLVHFAINARSLVLLPLVVGRVWRER